MSVSLDTSSYLSAYQTLNSGSSTAASGLESTLNNTNTEDSTDEELMDVCKQFESYFVQQVIEEAKKTVQSDDDEGEYMQYFGDYYTQAIAEDITDSGQLGLAKQLYESMKR